VPDDSQRSDDFRPAVPLTPSACLEAIAARLDWLHQGAAGMLLRAIPVKTGGTGKVYGGFIYAALKDPRTNGLIDCRIPEALARDLEWNREAVFAGLRETLPSKDELLLQCSGGAAGNSSANRPHSILVWPSARADLVSANPATVWPLVSIPDFRPDKLSGSATGPPQTTACGGVC
jgi:hypothetical protein